MPLLLTRFLRHDSALHLISVKIVDNLLTLMQISSNVRAKPPNRQTAKLYVPHAVQVGRLNAYLYISNIHVEAPCESYPLQKLEIA